MNIHHTKYFFIAALQQILHATCEPVALQGFYRLESGDSVGIEQGMSQDALGRSSLAKSS